MARGLINMDMSLSTRKADLLSLPLQPRRPLFLLLSHKGLHSRHILRLIRGTLLLLLQQHP